MELVHSKAKMFRTEASPGHVVCGISMLVLKNCVGINNQYSLKIESMAPKVIEAALGDFCELLVSKSRR